MTKSKLFLSITALEMVLAVFAVARAGVVSKQWRAEVLPEKSALVKSLGLTDLAIWTEARYTRHPSQADFFTPFQDLPSALEHFPAGSIVSPEALEDAVRRTAKPDPDE